MARCMSNPPPKVVHGLLSFDPFQVEKMTFNGVGHAMGKIKYTELTESNFGQGGPAKDLPPQVPV